MQSQAPNTGSPSPVNHPVQAEWMTLLYDEAPPAHRRELEAHLAQCASCREQVNQWRAGMSALDAWSLPASPIRPRRQAAPTVIKWAAAAAVLLAVGFALGRQNSSTAGEIAALKKSVRELSNRAAQGVSDETLELMASYAKASSEERAQDRQKFALALRELDTRLAKVRSELETVAINTETGFQRAQDGLSQLASFAATEHNPTPDGKHSENK